MSNIFSLAWLFYGQPVSDKTSAANSPPDLWVSLQMIERNLPPMGGSGMQSTYTTVTN